MTGLKFSAGHMSQPGHAHGSGGENIVLVTVPGLLDAVGGHQDRSRKFGEFPDLVLPGRAVMPVEMGVFLEGGVPVGRQHLPVGVDVDSLAFGLLEKLFQVFEVMARHQDGFSLFNSQGDFGGNGMPVGSGVSRVEKLHGAKVDLPAFEDQLDPVIQTQVFPQGGGKPFMDEGVNPFILLPQNLGMVGVSGNPFQTKKESMLQGKNIGVDGGVRFQPDFFPLGGQSFKALFRLESGRPIGEIRLSFRIFNFFFQLIPQLDALVD